MKNNILRKTLVITILFLLVHLHLLFISAGSILQNNNMTNNISNNTHCTTEVYIVDTKDGFSITLTRYIGPNHPPVILLHGMGGNHLMFDWDCNHSLARYLNSEGWDVWMLDLRTHDGDGDFFFVNGSDREYLHRYWDFDNTLLKVDVVTAVDFVKQRTDVNKIVLSGHSYGGYLAYAYAEIIGEENLSGIITTGACPYENPREFQPKWYTMMLYGFYCGKKAFVNPLGMPWKHMPKCRCDYYFKHWKPTANALFYYNTTPAYIQKQMYYHTDNEPAGVWVDMYFGKDPRKYNGHWVDPQTLYDYSENLHKITVPILFIAGEKDPQDPSTGIYRAYENVSSTRKEFQSFPNHSHLDLLLADDASSVIFPLIISWMNSYLTK